MPYYEFISPDGALESIFFLSKDVPSIGETIIHNDLPWRRLASHVNASFDTVTDEYSKDSFAKQFQNKHFTQGDMWKASAEFSERRAAKEGLDPIKVKNDKVKDAQGLPTSAEYRARKAKIAFDKRKTKLKKLLK